MPSGKISRPQKDQGTSDWWVYVLRSVKSSMTYTGVLKGPESRTQFRLAQHNGIFRGGAKSTRAHRPWMIAKVLGPFGKQEAYKMEAIIKRMTPTKKQFLVSGYTTGSLDI